MMPGLHESPKEAPRPPAPTVREVFEEHSHRVARTLRYLGVAQADLPDAVQDVFMVVHRKLPEFQGHSSLTTWLFGIATRVAAAHTRRVHHQREELMGELPERSVEAEQPAAVERDQTRERLLRLLDGLDEAKRTVFVLFEIEERSMAEVAEIVGCPLRTAYARLEAARRQVVSGWEQADLGGGSK